MSDESDQHDRSRDAEIQRAIAKLKEDVANGLLSPEEQHSILARIVSVLSSEYGTILRIMTRQDQASKDRKAIHDKLFGAEPGDENCMAARVNETYAVMRSAKRVGMALVTAMIILVVTKWYENTKLNEIIAHQKAQPVTTQPK